jgi:two-component system chemotaxis response regulator CheY
MVFLVVDSSPTRRRIVINSLKSLGYQEFFEANDGRDALVLLHTESINFVISEWTMPVIDGLELTTYIRTDEELERLPILLISSKSNKEEIVEAMKAKVSNYLVRPFTLEALKEKIDSIIFLQ